MYRLVIPLEDEFIPLLEQRAKDELRTPTMWCKFLVIQTLRGKSTASLCGVGSSSKPQDNAEWHKEIAERKEKERQGIKERRDAREARKLKVQQEKESEHQIAVDRDNFFVNLPGEEFLEHLARLYRAGYRASFFYNWIDARNLAIFKGKVPLAELHRYYDLWIAHKYNSALARTEESIQSCFAESASCLTSQAFSPEEQEAYRLAQAEKKLPATLEEYFASTFVHKRTGEARCVRDYVWSFDQWLAHYQSEIRKIERQISDKELDVLYGAQ